MDKATWKKEEIFKPSEGQLESEKDPDHLKILVLGDSNVGKTCMCVTFVDKQFPGEYIPTVTDISVTKIEGSNKTVSLSLYDTTGRSDYFLIRRQWYPNTKVILFCYSVINPDSLFHALKREYLEEFKDHLPNIPVILVGCKTDLRNQETIERLKEKNQQIVTPEQAKEVAKAYGFAASMECSSLHKEGLNEIFAQVLKVAAKKGPKNSNCILM